MSRNDLDLSTTEGKREFHLSVVTKCGWAKKKPSGIWKDDQKYSKDHYHYHRSKRELEKLEKAAKPNGTGAFDYSTGLPL